MRTRIQLCLLVFGILITILFCLAGCQKTVAPPSKSELAALYEIEESEIDKYHQMHPKVMAVPSEEDNFVVDRLIVCVYPFAYHYDFKSEDFAEVGCLSVEPLIGPYENSETPSRFLILTLDTDSKSELIEAADVIGQRADVFNVEADYIITIT